MGSDQNKWGLKFMTTNNQTSIASLAKNKEHTVLNLNSRSFMLIKHRTFQLLRSLCNMD